MNQIKTKTIATLGPSSNSLPIISDLIEYGMDVARINMSHFNSEEDFKNLANAKIELRINELKG